MDEFDAAATEGDEAQKGVGLDLLGEVLDEVLASVVLVGKGGIDGVERDDDKAALRRVGDGVGKNAGRQFWMRGRLGSRVDLFKDRNLLITAILAEGEGVLLQASDVLAGLVFY